MIGKLLFAAMSVALPAYALNVSAQTPVSSDVVRYAQVRQVDCNEGKGTAVNTDKGWISADHVTSLSFCEIEGHPIDAKGERGLDFSTLRVAIRGAQFKVNCDGIKPGSWVFAAGYAGGYSWQTMTRHLATYQKTDDGLRILLGSPTVIPGMSGGAVLNEKGEIVGIVNAYSKIYPISYTRELRDTSLCRTTGSVPSQASLTSGLLATLF
jgi:hypothetical protein